MHLLFTCELSSPFLRLTRISISPLSFSWSVKKKKERRYQDSTAFTAIFFWVTGWVGVTALLGYDSVSYNLLILEYTIHDVEYTHILVSTTLNLRAFPSALGETWNSLASSSDHHIPANLSKH